MPMDIEGNLQKTETNVKNTKHWKALEKTDGYDGDLNS